MSKIDEIRARFPQYAEFSDGDLLLGLHKKHYSQMHVKDFLAKLDPDDTARFSITDNFWPYWEE